MFYLFHGPDEFSMHEEMERLRHEPRFDLNVDVYAGDDADLSEIIVTCDTVPFLSEQRLVVVDGLPKRRRTAKNAEESDDTGSMNAMGTTGAASGTTADGGQRKNNGKSKKARASASDPRAFALGLADHVPQLPQSSVLLVLVGEALEATHPLVKAADRFGQARFFAVPKGSQLESWMTQRAQRHGAQLAPDAMRLLTDYIGSDLRVLAQEIEKLATYVGSGGRIAAAEVQLLTPITERAGVFDLTDALARRDRARALALLHDLLDAGESPLGIVALTAHQTRTLLQVKSLAEQGLRAPQIAQQAGMAPFVVEKSLSLARQFTFAQLESAHRSLLEIDTALKLSKMTPEMALDLFVVGFGG
jgi:DNA polymerase III subunit delta